MTDLPFIKMHGLGNDFVVLDARETPIDLNPARAALIADRHRGVGCDQLIVLEKSKDALADAFMRIRNADGGEVSACGNAARCVADLIMRERDSDHTIIQTNYGLIDAGRSENGLVQVDMGLVQLDWREIPLSEAADTLHLDVGAGPLQDACCVSVGNPHAVYFVDNAETVPMEIVGPQIETHAMFPEFTNVEAVQVLARDRLRMRVWERGVGVTQACGTGACATLVAAARRGLTERKADVILDGGTLTIEWLPDNHVLMTGPVATAFIGKLDAGLLGGFLG